MQNESGTELHGFHGLKRFLGAICMVFILAKWFEQISKNRCEQCLYS